MGWMSAKLWRSQEEGWTLKYYITRVKTGSQSVGDQMSWRQDAVEKASTQQSGPSGPRLSSCSWREDAGLRNMSQRGWAPGWAAQKNGKETRLWPIEWGSICRSSVQSPTPSPTQPFQIKWEVYFSWELCRSSLLCRRYDSACMHMCLYSCSCLYNTFFF